MGTQCTGRLKRPSSFITPVIAFTPPPSPPHGDSGWRVNVSNNVEEIERRNCGSRLGGGLNWNIYGNKEKRSPNRLTSIQQNKVRSVPNTPLEQQWGWRPLTGMQCQWWARLKKSEEMPRVCLVTSGCNSTRRFWSRIAESLNPSTNRH